MALKPGVVTIDGTDPRTLTRSCADAAAPPVGARRVHIDRHAHNRETDANRPVAPGATVLDEQEVAGLRWTVLADPEGNEFCVAG